MPPLSKFIYGKRKWIQINSTVELKLAKVLCLPELLIQSDDTGLTGLDQLTWNDLGKVIPSQVCFFSLWG